MPAQGPTGDPAPGPPCRSCQAATVEGQRYCLACGELVGDRRLEPLAVLAARAEALGPSAPVVPAAGAPRAVPLAAAATAILVAGVSGMLVTGAGGGGARAAIITRPPTAAPVTTTAVAPAPVPRTTPDPPADASGGGSSSDDASPSASADATADATPEASSGGDAGDSSGGGSADGGSSGSGGDGGSTDPAPTTPRVWLLALEGPRAQEAIDRVAKQGVRLTGMSAIGSDALTNATALITGARPTPGAAPGTVVPPAAGAPASLPEQVLAGKQKWRAYVDALATGTPAPAGACAPAAAGDVAGAALAARLPFGRIAALQQGDACTGATTSLEALGNDLSSGSDIPALSYAALGGCAPPDRTAVALPDELSDAVTAITESTEYQQDGMLIVTTVGTTDPCGTAPAPPATAPAVPTADPAAPATTTATTATDPAAPAATPPLAPTLILTPDSKAGTTLATPSDQLALTRTIADKLLLTAPADAASATVPRLALPAKSGGGAKR